MPQLILIVAMFALLWLFLIRPQRARAQAHRDLVTKVSVGDEILTVGGLYGDVIEIDDGRPAARDRARNAGADRAARGRCRRSARRGDEEERGREEKTAALEEGESVLRDEEVRS